MMCGRRLRCSNSAEIRRRRPWVLVGRISGNAAASTMVRLVRRFATSVPAADPLTPGFIGRNDAPTLDIIADIKVFTAQLLAAVVARSALEQAIKNNRPSFIDVHVKANVRPPSTGTWQLPPIPDREPVFGKPWIA